jgi:septal ring factor EnvC (AmiA/AmiB activator)
MPQSGTTAPVVVSDAGQLGTVASSERFKKDIATMEKASEAILSLRPVTFHYKSDSKGTPQFGLVAEEVAKVNPGLVLPDKEGKPYTVRYDAVNAMLLNEFLKEHQTVQQQGATITQLKSTAAQQQNDFQAAIAQQQKQIEVLTAQLKEQAAQIQKVSAQLAAASPSRGGLEASKPAPQMVNNP